MLLQGINFLIFLKPSIIMICIKLRIELRINIIYRFKIRNRKLNLTFPLCLGKVEMVYLMLTITGSIAYEGVDREEWRGWTLGR